MYIYLAQKEKNQKEKLDFLPLEGFFSQIESFQTYVHWEDIPLDSNEAVSDHKFLLCQCIDKIMTRQFESFGI